MVFRKNFAPLRFSFSSLLCLSLCASLALPMHAVAAEQSSRETPVVKTAPVKKAQRAPQKSASALAVAMAFGLQTAPGPVKKVVPTNLSRAPKAQGQQYADRGL